MMIAPPSGALAAMATLVASMALAAAAPTGGHASMLMSAQLASNGMPRLTVTTPGFRDGAEFPREFTQYGGNRFPGLAWTAGPAGTRSYVVVLQGKSLEKPGSGTSIHFFAYNIAAGVTKLDAGLSALPAGAAMGPVLHGGREVYVGPHTHTAEKHGYHFQVFALDTLLQPAPGASLDAIVQSMQGHVRASGEIMGWAAKTDDQP